ncbi:hypothetical protein D9M69_655140 [compost metagenome]
MSLGLKCEVPAKAVRTLACSPCLASRAEACWPYTLMTCLIPAAVVMGLAKEREKISWSRPIRSSSMGMQGVPCSSRTVRIITTENRSLIATGSVRTRSAMVKMPITFSRLVSRPAMPHTSSTDSRPSNASRSGAGMESQ